MRAQSLKSSQILRAHMPYFAGPVTIVIYTHLNSTIRTRMSSTIIQYNNNNILVCGNLPNNNKTKHVSKRQHACLASQTNLNAHS